MQPSTPFGDLAWQGAWVLRAVVAPFLIALRRWLLTPNIVVQGIQRGIARWHTARRLQQPPAAD